MVNNTKGWLPDEIGYQRTKSPQIIKSTLDTLKSTRRFVTLVHSGYQSGNTVLVDYNKKQLLIDKPVDWPDTHDQILVVYRDDARIWNHFSVKVTAITSQNLYTDMPGELFQLQRRNQYRVDLPLATKISFIHKKNIHPGFKVHDISVGGILVYRKKKDLFVKDDMLNNISINIPSDEPAMGEENGEDTQISIKQGRVVRTFQNQRLHLFYAGIRLVTNVKEEEELMRYVRQRELELLRMI